MLLNKSVVSKRNLFVDRWSNAEHLNAKLVLMLFLQMLMVIVLSGGLLFSCVHPRPVYYISPNGAGIASPTGLPDSAVGIFTLSWLMNWSNFNPSNVTQVYERAQQWMSPALWSKTQQRLKDDIDEIKRNTMSSLFSLTDDPKVELSGKNYQVTIKGQKAVFVGNQQISTQQLTYILLVRKITPTNINPYGLLIEDIEQDLMK